MARKNKIESVLERRVKVAKLYLQGWYQADIAKQVGVTQQQVSSDLKALRKEWLASSIRDFDKARDQELFKIDNLEREYWAAWEKSKTDYSKKSIKAKGTKKELNQVEKTDTEVIMIGNKQFLDGVMTCINKRCEILGLDAPKKQELTGAGGKDLMGVDGLSDAERTKLLGILENM